MRARALLTVVAVLILAALSCGPPKTPAADLLETSAAQTVEAQLATFGPTDTPPPAPTETPSPVATDTPTVSPSSSPPPAPTHAPAPTDTPHVPTSTPTAVPPTETPALCAIAIAPEFVSRLGAHPDVLLALGCPVVGRQQTWTAEARFQKGRMFWQQNTDTIHILYDGAGAFQIEPDRYVDGDPEDACPEVGDAPAGLFKPVRGFNWHWCNTAGVRAGLGWALGEEAGYDAVWQGFERGHVLQSRTDHIFIFHADGAWGYIE